LYLDPKNVTHIVVHTAATPTRSIDISAASIDAYHRHVKGWDMIGYHRVVRFGGDIEEGRPLDRVGAQVEGFNSQSIGICFSGNGDLADFTDHQWIEGPKLVAQLLKHFGLEGAFKKNEMRVIGHREINLLIEAGVTDAPRTSKTCPGKRIDMRKFRTQVRKWVGKV
jgi:hypothetical protein